MINNQYGLYGRRIKNVATVLFASAVMASAATVTVTVPGVAEPWEAGMPASGTSPVLALTGFANGSSMTFSTASTCGFNYSGGCGPVSADGDIGSGGGTGARNGISDFIAPFNSQSVSFSLGTPQT